MYNNSSKCYSNKCKSGRLFLLYVLFLFSVHIIWFYNLTAYVLLRMVHSLNVLWQLMYMYYNARICWTGFTVSEKPHTFRNSCLILTNLYFQKSLKLL